MDDPNPSAPVGCRFDATLKSKAPTWTVGLAYKPMSNLLLYGKISRGYKAGGFNPFAVRVSTQTFKPEFVTTYEAGFKSDWRIGTVPARLNVTAYTSDYKDAQRGAVDFNPGAIGAQIPAADARIRIEAEATIRPFAQLELGGNLSYTDAKYKEYFYVAPTDSVDCDGPVAQGSPHNATCLAFGVAKWIYSVHASLDVPVPETFGKLNLFVNYSQMSKLPLAENEPGGVIEPFRLLNLNVSLRSVGGSNFDLELFMMNATNKLYRISNSNISGSGYYSSLYGESRMYGARVRYSF